MAEQKTVPDDRLDELREGYVRGDRLNDMAATFAVTPKSLRQTIKDLGLTRGSIKRVSVERSSLSKNEIEGLLDAYGDPRNSVAELLSRFNISTARLYAELQKAGRPRRKEMPSKTARLTEADRSKIARSYLEGSSATEIADRSGLNYDQVYVVLREARVPLKGESHLAPHMQPTIQERFRDLYLDDAIAVADILKQLGITQYDFKRLMMHLQLPPRGKGGGKRSIPAATAARMPEFARRYEAGESIAKLAEEAGIGLATMKVRLRKLRQFGS